VLYVATCDGQYPAVFRERATHEEVEDAVNSFYAE
jgi:hypothetical protein